MNIVQNKLVSVRIEPNFKKLGIKRGHHVYLNNGNTRTSVDVVSRRMESYRLQSTLEIQILWETFTYDNTDRLLEKIENMKHTEC